MMVVSDFVRPAFSSMYEVAGRFLLLGASEQQSATTVQRFLERWHMLLVPPGGQEKANATILLKLEDPPEIPDGFETFPLVEGANGYASDTSYYIVFADESVMSADESAIVTIWLKEPLDPEDSVLAQLVSHALSAALRRCGVFELHSGAVVDPDSGKSILICGPSGSGKSTLTLQLAATGWSYLSDDVMLLSTDRDKVKATGLRRFFALTQETAEGSGLPELNELLNKMPASEFGKRRLEPRDLFPQGLVEECWPNVIFFPAITGAETSRVRELSPAETMSRLIRLCPWSCYDRAVAREFLDGLAKLVKQSVSFDLFAGNDLMGDPSYTSQFLASPLKEQLL